MGTEFRLIDAFYLQVIVLLSYLPVTFLAYRFLREPQKRRRTQAELDQFNLPQAEEIDRRIAGGVYSLWEYVIPLTYIMLILAALYGMTHPAVIERLVWRGLLESVANVFGISGGEPLQRELMSGRFMFYCWLGAYIHAVHRTIRHYLLQDLSPNVYVLAAQRFIVAFVVGTIVGLSMASAYRRLGFSVDANLAAVYLVSFCIGAFPDVGLRYIKKATLAGLKLNPEKDRQKPLSLVDGLGEWQQGRLDQEGIVNVQNLATVNLIHLVMYTPFDVGQIVDWVDQAILITYASERQLGALNNAGLRLASDVLNAVEGDLESLAKATRLSQSELRMLAGSLSASANIGLVRRYWMNSGQPGAAVSPILASIPAHPNPR